MLLNDGYIEKVTISWALDENPKAKQQELLDGFKKEHGDCPVWNISKKVAVNPPVATQKTPKVAKPRPSRKQPAKPAP